MSWKWKLTGFLIGFGLVLWFAWGVAGMVRDVERVMEERVEMRYEVLEEVR